MKNPSAIEIIKSSYDINRDALSQNPAIFKINKNLYKNKIEIINKLI